MSNESLILLNQQLFFILLSFFLFVMTANRFIKFLTIMCMVVQGLMIIVNLGIEFVR